MPLIPATSADKKDKEIIVNTNPYQRYAESNLVSERPEQLLVALYQHACDNVSSADRFNQAGDPVGRGQAINRVMDVLVELTASLDPQIELSGQLRELYVYMQQRLLEAHIEQSSEKLQEVLRLLTTLLSAWREVANPVTSTDYRLAEEVAPAVLAGISEPAVAVAYGRF
jgi:flagellar protein FliS